MPRSASIRSFIRRNAVGVVALFVALGGSAYAANTVRSTDIVDGEVRTADIAARSVTTAKIVDGAVNGAKVNEASLGQVPLAAKAANALGAVVNPNGTLAGAAQSGTTSTHVGAANSGTYTVRFGRNLGNCAAVAALGNNQNNVPNPGEIGASLSFDDSVIVQTRTSAGAPADNGFELIVVC
jgi:hypothetical protein